MKIHRRSFLALLGLPALAASQVQIDKAIVAKRVVETEKDLGAVDGKNQVFTLGYLPSSNGSVDVHKNGLLLREGRDYTLAVKTITFTSAPDVGDSIDVKYGAEFNA